MAKNTYDIIIIDECGDEQTYYTGFSSRFEAEQKINSIFESNPEFLQAWVEPNTKNAYQQAWQDRVDNDTVDLY